MTDAAYERRKFAIGGAMTLLGGALVAFAIHGIADKDLATIVGAFGIAEVATGGYLIGNAKLRI
jgi:hypothetical protein